jgi:signal transduction histidine kinase
MGAVRGNPERNDTDESLGRERDKTDDELVDRTERYKETADTVVEQARGRADAVVERARGKADEKLRRSGVTGEEWSTLEGERQMEDHALDQERLSADASLSVERDERRRALAKLLQLERASTDEHLGRERDMADASVASRDDFLAMASHDLRNMLGGIALSAESLMNIRREEDVQQAIGLNAHRIQRYTGRMARFVGDLVDIVSIEAGRLAIAPRRHDVVDLVRETLDAFQPLASAKGMRIGADVKGGALSASYDHERILQVLSNLVGNALKFVPDGGHIHILVESLDGALRFAVADDGPGIAPEKLQSIFDRYWQAAEKRPRSGLGLGLFISKCIVEAHGGTIWAESRLGEGSTFRFTLPVETPVSVRA